MKLSLSFIFLSTLFLNYLPLQGETAHPQEQTTIIGEEPAHYPPPTAPSFTPPKDMQGPVFPPEEFLERPKTNDKFFSEFLNMLATLGLIIAVILLAAWFLRRLLNTRLENINTTSTIKVVERRSLSPKTAIYLLEIYDKTILIAESHNGVTSLSEFITPEEEDDSSQNSPNPNPSSFSKLMEKK